MIEQKDIAIVTVVCDKINFSIDREKVVLPGMNLNFNITTNWGIYAIRDDNKSIKSKVAYILKSQLLQGEVEATVIIDFQRELTSTELSSPENQKQIAIKSVNYVVQWIADISSKMGISPVVIPAELFTKLIQNAK